jgi:hypothetical protein
MADIANIKVKYKCQVIETIGGCLIIVKLKNVKNNKWNLLDIQYRSETEN